MKKITILIVISLLIGGCEWRKFEFAGIINVEEDYILESSSSINESAKITRSQVRDAFDIPENADVKKVEIENMSLRVTLLEKNQAKFVNLTGYIREGSENLHVFKDYSVPLIGVNAPWIGLNALISEGVEKIRGKLISYLKENDGDPFSIILTGDAQGTMVHARIDLIIKGSVVYEECLEVLPGMGGDPCDGN